MGPGEGIKIDEYVLEGALERQNRLCSSYNAGLVSS